MHPPSLDTPLPYYRLQDYPNSPPAPDTGSSNWPPPSPSAPAPDTGSSYWPSPPAPDPDGPYWLPPILPRSPHVPHRSLSTMVIAGPVIGLVLIIVGLVSAGLFIRRRNRARERENPSAPPQPQDVNHVQLESYYLPPAPAMTSQSRLDPSPLNYPYWPSVPAVASQGQRADSNQLPYNGGPWPVNGPQPQNRLRPPAAPAYG
ncbi:vegetative cell wall protein gp1-like [Neltuma alba]|uniref:vegetative cell wall protein gp1-like n=1 Tax=Neltuma alba TaxID=207710 RepID=UPI0010A515E9|nr:vegetative cell wall protein gp1-like [Prosopis alba]